MMHHIQQIEEVNRRAAEQALASRTSSNAEMSNAVEGQVFYLLGLETPNRVVKSVLHNHVLCSIFIHSHSCTRVHTVLFKYTRTYSFIHSPKHNPQLTRSLMLILIVDIT